MDREATLQRDKTVIFNSTNNSFIQGQQSCYRCDNSDQHVGLSWAGMTSGRVKFDPFFHIKNITVWSSLKAGRVEPNCLKKQKKLVRWSGRIGSGHTGLANFGPIFSSHYVISILSCKNINSSMVSLIKINK